MFDKEIYKRMDLGRISSFVLDGEGDSDCAISYDERLKSGIDPIYKRLERIYTDKTEFNDAIAELYKALNAHEEVYMELGMKAGARLLHQLIFNGDSKPTTSCE